MKRWSAALILCLGAPVALADEATIRRVLEPKLGGVRIDTIEPAPVPGLFEVRFRTAEGVRIVYTDAAASHILVGNLYEAKTDRNLTQERIRKLSAIRFDSLPLELAVKVQRGNGKRVLAMFSDPYCPACQAFEKELIQVEDITIYVFMLPVIRPEQADQSKAIWCSPDRAKAWVDLALRGRRPGAGTSCDHPLAKIDSLANRLGIRATPTLFFANGERNSGGLSSERLREMLDEAGPVPVAKPR